MRPIVAALLSVLFLTVVAGVPAVELSGLAHRGQPPAAAWRALLGGLAGNVGGELRDHGLLAANRLLLAQMSHFEERLEEESVLVATVVPHARAALLAGLGIGGPEVYPGRDRWLFYRPDVEHVTGPGFLEPSVLAARARGGDAWVAPPSPDPRPALERFAADLAARGITLVVMSTPLKPEVYPERLSRRLEARARPLANPSSAALAAALEEAGISVFDPGPALLEAAEEPSYLVADTHWSPAGMERVAAALARHLLEEASLKGEGEIAWRRRPVVVEGIGDTARMLELPSWGQGLLARQRVEVLQVTAPTGALWRPQPGAPVLLLGDSFTNVFSSADLGWGAGGGLAEQLAYHLGRPVDRIARNAGGAFASREELSRALARGEPRLQGTRVVVLQFASRELSFGDWKVIPLPQG